jgi:hypothetical protein
LPHTEKRKNKREIRKVDLLAVLANGWVGDLVLVPTKARSMDVFQYPYFA